MSKTLSLSWLRNLLVLGITSSCAALAAPVDVSVTYPSPTKHYQTLLLTGTVESDQDALLAPLESGLVATLHVEVGDQVERGQALLTLDNKLALLAERQAMADHKAAEVALADAKRLFQETEALSKQQLAAKTLREQRMTEVASAEAELARQEANLDLRREILNRHVLNAPFAGVVYQRSVDVGEWITPATGVLSLVSYQNRRLSIQVPQEYYGLLTQLNSAIKVLPGSRNQSIVMGKLERIVGVSNSQSRTFTAHVALPSEADLLIGMSAQAQINLPDTEQTAFWLPVSTIKQHPDGGASIFAAVNNRAKRILIDIIERRGDAVLVTNAEAGQAYVSSGVELITDNTELKINE